MIFAVAVLLGLVLLRWGLLLGGAALLIPRIRACPACFAETLPVRKAWLRRVAPWLGWRWCPACGWEGVSRRRGSALVPTPELRRREAEERRRRGPRKGAPRPAVDEEWAEGD